MKPLQFLNVLINYIGCVILITYCVLNQNALVILCRLLVKSIIYFAESKHNVECVRTKVHCAAVTCLLYVGGLQLLQIHKLFVILFPHSKDLKVTPPAKVMRD